MKKITITLSALFITAAAAFAQAPLTNGDFETWGQLFGTPEEPTGWVTANTFANPLLTFPNPNPNPTSVFKAGTPDNYQGSFSCKITTVDLQYNPDPVNIPNRIGACILGTVVTTPSFDVIDGKPYTSRPATFTYYAKYTPTSGDTAYCFTELTRWNSNTMQRETVAEGFDFIAGTVSAYAQRTITYDYASFNNSNFPDTLRMTFSSSGTTVQQAGSIFFIDAGTFGGWVGVDEASAAAKNVNVFPNPASNEVNFTIASDKAAKVEITDMTGRTVKVVDVTNHKAKEMTHSYANGLYNYTILDENNAVITRGKFTVVK